MKPVFAVLKANHMDRRFVPPQVYDAIGHSELALDPAWHNTCAVRMSIALVGAGVRIRTGPARLRINAGPHKGEQLEPSQKVLSDYLLRVLGKPEKYPSGAAAKAAIGWRRGIISFFSLYGTRQGHIDLVSVEDWGAVQCSVACYWEAREVWFWPLK